MLFSHTTVLPDYVIHSFELKGVRLKIARLISLLRSLCEISRSSVRVSEVAVPIRAAFFTRASNATATADSSIAPGSAMIDRVPHTSDKAAGWKGKIYTTAAYLPPTGWKVRRNLVSVVAVLPQPWPGSSAASRDKSSFSLL